MSQVFLFNKESMTLDQQPDKPMPPVVSGTVPYSSNVYKTWLADMKVYEDYCKSLRHIKTEVQWEEGKELKQDVDFKIQYQRDDAFAPGWFDCSKDDFEKETICEKRAIAVPTKAPVPAETDENIIEVICTRCGKKYQKHKEIPTTICGSCKLDNYILDGKSLMPAAEGVDENIRTPIEDALYATGRFNTEQATNLAEGILLYLKDAGYIVLPASSREEDAAKHGLEDILNLQYNKADPETVLGFSLKIAEEVLSKINEKPKRKSSRQ